MSQIGQPVPRYPALTRFLHWIVALMLIATIPIGVLMQTEGLARATQNLLYILHKNGGVILLVLVLLRILWRVIFPAPPMPASMPGWQVKVARLAHWGLYGLVLVMAISGYVRVAAGGFPIEMLDALGVPKLVPRSEPLAQTAKWVHSTARFALVALILLHVGAALKHLMQRDGVFGRIWPPLGRG
jgi:cytochrome b561